MNKNYPSSDYTPLVSTVFKKEHCGLEFLSASELIAVIFLTYVRAIAEIFAGIFISAIAIIFHRFILPAVK